MSGPDRARYLAVERPDQSATVDFLSDDISVTLTVEDGVLRVSAKMLHGENASTWDEHEVEWPVPEPTEGG